MCKKHQSQAWQKQKPNRKKKCLCDANLSCVYEKQNKEERAHRGTSA